MANHPRIITYKTQLSYRHQTHCQKCKKPFQNGDKLYNTSTHKKYHYKCWENTQI